VKVHSKKRTILKSGTKRDAPDRIRYELDYYVHTRNLLPVLELFSPKQVSDFLETSLGNRSNSVAYYIFEKLMKAEGSIDAYPKLRAALKEHLSLALNSAAKEKKGSLDVVRYLVEKWEAKVSSDVLWQALVNPDKAGLHYLIAKLPESQRSGMLSDLLSEARRNPSQQANAEYLAGVIAKSSAVLPPKGKEEAGASPDNKAVPSGNRKPIVLTDIDAMWIRDLNGMQYIDRMRAESDKVCCFTSFDRTDKVTRYALMQDELTQAVPKLEIITAKRKEKAPLFAEAIEQLGKDRDYIFYDVAVDQLIAVQEKAKALGVNVDLRLVGGALVLIKAIAQKQEEYDWAVKGQEVTAEKVQQVQETVQLLNTFMRHLPAEERREYWAGVIKELEVTNLAQDKLFRPLKTYSADGMGTPKPIVGVLKNAIYDIEPSLRINALFTGEKNPFSSRLNFIKVQSAHRAVKDIPIEAFVDFMKANPESARGILDRRYGTFLPGRRNFRQELAQKPELIESMINSGDAVLLKAIVDSGLLYTHFLPEQKRYELVGLLANPKPTAPAVVAEAVPEMRSAAPVSPVAESNVAPAVEVPPAEVLPVESAEEKQAAAERFREAASQPMFEGGEIWNKYWEVFAIVKADFPTLPEEGVHQVALRRVGVKFEGALSKKQLSSDADKLQFMEVMKGALGYLPEAQKIPPKIVVDHSAHEERVRKQQDEFRAQELAKWRLEKQSQAQESRAPIASDLHDQYMALATDSFNAQMFRGVYAEGFTAAQLRELAEPLMQLGEQQYPGRDSTQIQENLNKVIVVVAKEALGALYEKNPRSVLDLALTKDIPIDAYVALLIENPEKYKDIFAHQRNTKNIRDLKAELRGKPDLIKLLAAESSKNGVLAAAWYELIRETEMADRVKPLTESSAAKTVRSLHAKAKKTFSAPKTEVSSEDRLKEIIAKPEKSEKKVSVLAKKNLAGVVDYIIKHPNDAKVLLQAFETNLHENLRMISRLINEGGKDIHAAIRASTLLDKIPGGSGAIFYMELETAENKFKQQSQPQEGQQEPSETSHTDTQPSATDTSPSGSPSISPREDRVELQDEEHDMYLQLIQKPEYFKARIFNEAFVKNNSQEELHELSEKLFLYDNQEQNGNHEENIVANIGKIVAEKNRLAQQERTIAEHQQAIAAKEKPAKQIDELSQLLSTIPSTGSASMSQQELDEILGETLGETNGDQSVRETREEQIEKLRQDYKQLKVDSAITTANIAQGVPEAPKPKAGMSREETVAVTGESERDVAKMGLDFELNAIKDKGLEGVLKAELKTYKGELPKSDKVEELVTAINNKDQKEIAKLSEGNDFLKEMSRLAAEKMVPTVPPPRPK
jgi:hypothetical protein